MKSDKYDVIIAESGLRVAIPKFSLILNRRNKIVARVPKQKSRSILLDQRSARITNASRYYLIYSHMYYDCKQANETRSNEFITRKKHEIINFLGAEDWRDLGGSHDHSSTF